MEKMRKALENLGACKGECYACGHLRMQFAERGNTTYYAMWCGLCDSCGLTPYADRMADVKSAAIHALEFELS